MRHQKAIEIAEESFLTVLNDGIVGKTEKKVAKQLEYEMKRKGAEDTAFDTIVAAGESGAEIHHEPGNRKIGRDETVVVDLGAVAEGVCSDMTRTLVFGELGSRGSDIRRAVMQASREAAEALEPGVPGSEVDAAARSVISDAGYGDDFVHGVGHGVGSEVHESPKLAPESEETLEEGDVVTIEPGIYIEGEMGFRHEDMFRVNSDGAEKLTSLEL